MFGPTTGLGAQRRRADSGQASAKGKNRHIGNQADSWATHWQEAPRRLRRVTPGHEIDFYSSAGWRTSNDRRRAAFTAVARAETATRAVFGSEMTADPS